MKYWIKSCPPLVIRKAYVDNIPEMLEWMDRVIVQTKKDFEDIDAPFPPHEELDIFKTCFVLLKVDPKRTPMIKEILKSGSPSSVTMRTLKEKFPNLNEELEKSAQIPQRKRDRKRNLL